MKSPFPDKMPRWVMPSLALMFVISWIPLSMVAVDRATTSPEPRISIVPDMDNQEKFLAQESNQMFADHRAMRLPVAGTVAYGDAHLDDWLYRGIKNGQWAADFPIRPTKEMMDRGHQRFDIYCSPCHGYSGYGNGMVAVRADELLEGTWVSPANLHDKLVRGRPVGHIFNTITNGIRNMPPYGPQVPVADRWAIVLYVRALQRSQHASLSDVGNASDAQMLESMRLPAEQAEQQAAKQAADAAAKVAADEKAAASKPQAGADASSGQKPGETPAAGSSSSSGSQQSAPAKDGEAPK